MRTPFDRLAKDLLKALLEPVCRTVTPEREVTADAQRLDLWCDPDPQRLPRLERLELLRRMLLDGACAFEFFHAAPSLDEVMSALRKALALRHSAADAVTLWIIAAGRPHRVFDELPSLRRLESWPAGVYGLDPGLGVRMIIANELPRSADTLLFRLLGARRTLRDALPELDRLPEDDALGRAARPLVVRLLSDARESLPSTPQLEEFVMETQEWYEKWQRDLRAEGETRGRAKGEARAIVKFLRGRGLEVPPDAEARIESTTDLGTLERWLDLAAKVSSVDELFASS